MAGMDSSGIVVCAGVRDERRELRGGACEYGAVALLGLADADLSGIGEVGDLHASPLSMPL